MGAPDRLKTEVGGGVQSEPDGVGRPRQNHVRPVRNQGQERRERKRIAGVAASEPFSVIVHPIAIRVGGIGRGIDRQPMLLQPGIGNPRSGRLKFIRADVQNPFFVFRRVP